MRVMKNTLEKSEPGMILTGSMSLLVKRKDVRLVIAWKAADFEVEIYLPRAFVTYMPAVLDVSCMELAVPLGLV